MQIRSVMTSYCLQLKSGKYLINDISGNIVPWVPEDIFFLSILMVGVEVALTRKKITSGHRSTQPHFHVRNHFRI